MQDKDIKKAFEEIRLDPTRKDAIWEKIEASAGEKKVKSGHMHKWLVAASVAVCLLLSTVICDKISGGMVTQAASAAVETIKSILGINQGKQDVISIVSRNASLGTEVYAPDIMYIDDEVVVFGTSRGLIVMNKDDNTLLGIIDLQAIGSFYFTAETKATHVLCDGTRIVIYNTENEVPYGKYYVYELADADVKDWPHTEGGDPEKLAKYDSMYQNFVQNYVDTFDTFCEIGLGAIKLDPNDDRIKYSEVSLKWVDKDGRDCISTLYIVKDEGEAGFRLSTYYPKNNNVEEIAIVIPAIEGEEGEDVILPEFAYTGNDAALAAILTYQKENYVDAFYPDEDGIWVPAYVIFGRFERDGKLYVFGNFVDFTYVLNGNIFECISGGACPARYTLNITDEGYTVEEVLRAEDGNGYTESIKAFTEGFDGMYEALIAWGDEYKEKENEARMYFLKMYLDETTADIRYYKDYGWDPVEIK